MGVASKLFTDIYAPKRKEDIIGDAKNIEILLQFLSGKPLPGRKKALWLTGPPGTGKTIAVHVIARALDLELVEVNASDVRNAAGIDEVLGSASKQMSLFSRGKVLLIDEVDGLSGHSDRGGVGAITKIIEESTFPAVLTSFDSEEHKLSSLKKICLVLPFEPHTASAVGTLLRKVVAAERVTIDDDALSLLSRKAAGDLRAALNDLQALSLLHHHGKLPLTTANVDVLGDRRRVETMQRALLKIFKSSDPEVVRRVLDDVEEDIDELFLWIDENIPREYQSVADRARAFETLARADVFFGRIRKWQHYRFYSYCYDLLSAGIALAKDQRYAGGVEYQRTTRILRIWIANQQHAKRKAVATKLAPYLHVSARQAVKDMAYLRAIAKDPGYAETWKDAYHLEEEEAEWLAQ